MYPSRNSRMFAKFPILLCIYIQIIGVSHKHTHTHYTQSTPQQQQQQGEETSSTANNSSVATQTEPPPRGVSDLWGLDEQIDKWQVSAMPEEKQYFSMDVSHKQ